MRRHRHRFARGAFSNGLGFRLPSMVMALLILGLVYSNAKDPAMWRWLASDASAADSGTASTAPAAAQPEVIVEGPTDQDEASWAEATELFQVINDRQALDVLEMPAYWLLLRWARSQSFQQLQSRADAKVPYGQLAEQPEKYRGKLIRLRLHVRQIVEYDAPENSAGIKKLYECWGWTDQSKTFPVGTVCLELPPGWRIGDQGAAHEEGVFVGYYFKNMRYTAASDKGRVSPLFLGRMADAGVGPGARGSSTAGGLPWVWLPTIGLIVCLGAWVWFRYSRTSSVSTRVRAVVNEAEVEDWLRQPGADPSTENTSSDPI
jgi:hypothetical protein